MWEEGLSLQGSGRGPAAGRLRAASSLQDDGHRDPPSFCPPVSRAPPRPECQGRYTTLVSEPTTAQRRVFRKEERWESRALGPALYLGHSLLCDLGQDSFPFWASVLPSAKAD